MIVCGNTQRRYALHTAHTTYQMAADADGRLLHLYYGKRTDAPRTIAPPHNDPGCWPDLLPQEYPAPGLGDNHAPFFAPEWSDGSRAAARRFAGAEVCPAQDVLPGLPSFHTGGETLRVTLQDLQGLTVTLRYTVFADCDLITRSAVVENTGSAPVTLRGVPSGVVDFARKDLDLITFDGAWAAERNPFRGPVRPGVQSIGSVGGIPPMRTTPPWCCAPPMPPRTGAIAGVWRWCTAAISASRPSAPLQASGFRRASSPMALPGPWPRGRLFPPRNWRWYTAGRAWAA